MIDPRARTVLAGETRSYFATTYKGKFSEAETIEFWVRVYTTKSSVAKVVLIKQDSHFTFSMNTSAAIFSVNTATPEDMCSQSFTAEQLSGWIYVAGVIGLNEIKSYIMLDENPPVVAANTISSLPSYASNSLIFEAVPDVAGRFVAGLREFKIWGKYKSPGELRGQRFVQPSTHAPGLMFYLPMDESSGENVVERISEASFSANKNYWLNQTDDTVIAHEHSSPLVRNSVALAMQGTGTLSFSLPNSSHTYNEITFMLWIRLTPAAFAIIKLGGYYPLTLTLNLALSTNTIAYSDYSEKITPPIEPEKWHSLAFVRGVSNRKVYLNGAGVASSYGIVSCSLIPHTLS